MKLYHFPAGLHRVGSFVWRMAIREILRDYYNFISLSGGSQNGNHQMYRMIHE